MTTLFSSHQNESHELHGMAKHSSPERGRGFSAVRVNEAEVLAFNRLQPFPKITLRILIIEWLLKKAWDVIPQIGVSTCCAAGVGL
jgi:hypothetical protein